ncbi:MAG: hypothetical protein LC641_02470 [Spirochaeta sp.]|nr:hypothetical protein [Spirochaeta sp.]
MAQAEADINWKDPSNRDKDAAIYGDEEFFESPDSSAEQNAGPESTENSVGSRKTVLTPRAKELRRLSRESQLAPSQRMPFLSAAELDEMRKPAERVGIAKLFEACCQHGTVHWLNPIAELRGITDNLGNFHGSPKVMRQFMYLLLELARAGVPPAAFVRYVMMPRMGLDADWRRWRERHFWALQRIAELLISMRGKKPFHEEFLPNSRTLTEVVLVKYVGKPLARFSVGVLEDESLLEQYKAGWQSLRLNHPVFVLFLRLNVFPFLYRLSGKVDLIQLVPIVRAAGQLEPEFAAAFSHEDLKKAEDIFSVSLYTEFEANMQTRADKGLTIFSLVREIKAYLAIIRALIRTNAGIYLSGYFASLLRSVIDPDCAEGLAELVPTVSDTGGMDALRRHARRFTSIDEDLRRQYIYDIQNHGGFHSEYEHRKIAPLFRDPEQRVNAQRRIKLSEQLGVALPDGPPEAGHIGADFDPLLKAYQRQHPQQAGLIDELIAELAAGKDAGWKVGRCRELDALGSAAREVCFYAGIPGTARGRPDQQVTAFTVTELYERYGSASEQQALRTQMEFTLPVHQFSDAFPEIVDAQTNAALRKKIDLPLLTEAYETVFGAEVVLARYGTRKDIAARAEYLQSDVAPHRPTLRQLALLINYLDCVRVEARVHSQALFPLPLELTNLLLLFDTHRSTPGWASFDAALRRLFQYGGLETEAARLLDLQSALTRATRAHQPTSQGMIVRASKSCIDAMYGEMGAPVYSGKPDIILRPGFQVLRLVDSENKRVVGVAYLAFSSAGIKSLNIRRFYFVFGFHLLEGLSYRLGRSGMMTAYLQLRKMVELLATKSGLPVFLPGATNNYIISDSQALADIILLYERKQKPREAADALKLDLRFPVRDYARGYLIIDPESHTGFHAETALKQLGG